MKDEHYDRLLQLIDNLQKAVSNQGKEIGEIKKQVSRLEYLDRINRGAYPCQE